MPKDLEWLVNPRVDVDQTLEEATQAFVAVGVEVESLAKEGDPANAILEVAEDNDADLIIVGNKGMVGVSRFPLGSVPNKISHHASCSVRIIRTT